MNQLPERRSTIGFYPGSFDPITLGHLDVIEQASRVFDRVHVAVGRNPKKTRLFSEMRSIQLISQSLMEVFPEELRDRITVGVYHGSMMDAARAIGATAIVRGLRQVSDFDDEFKLHGVIERILPEIPMTYLICQQQYLHVSSSTAKELAYLNADTSWMVAPCVNKALTEECR